MSNPVSDLIRVQVTRIRDRMKGHVVFGQRINSPDLELLAAYYLGHFDAKHEASGSDAKIVSGEAPILVDTISDTP